MKKVVGCGNVFVGLCYLFAFIVIGLVAFHDLKAGKEEKIDYSLLQCVEQGHRKTFNVAICQEKSKFVTVLTRNGKRSPIVDHAWNVSKGNLDFVLTIEGESSFNPKAIGDNGNSVGLCQRHQKRQQETRENKNFADPIWQVEKCRSNYSQRVKEGVIHKRLYAYNGRKKRIPKFKKVKQEVSFIECEKKQFRIFIPTNEK